MGTNAGALTGVQMLPCIIGPGAKVFQKTEAIVRGSTTQDLLTMLYPTSIIKISSYDGGPAAFIPTTDYSLSVDDSKGYVKWVADKGPAQGEPYYVTYLHEAQDSQFDVNIVFNKDTLISMYGTDIRLYENNYPINTLSTAGQVLFDNGATAVVVCQVKSTLEVPTKTEFQVGLDKIAALDKAWRIIPTVISDDIVAAVTQHLIYCSSYEERKERIYLSSTPYNSSRTAPTKFSGTGGVLQVIGDYTLSLADKRKAVIYPDAATMTFSDGVQRQVTGQILMAAFAGAECAQSLAKSRTRMKISGFYSLDGVTMSRTEMNALAEKGVTVLTQSEPGADIVVRHGMTTDYSTVQNREMSIVAISDFCAKSFRASCDMYIGKYSITNEVLSMIKGTLEGTVSDLVKKGIIISGTVPLPVQDTDNPDTVAASVKVYVPYPCNYITITMYLD